MKNNNIFSRENYPNLIFWCLCFILFLPIIIMPPNFQPVDWSRAILFRITLTILISLFFYRFFYKRDISFSLPKWGYLFYLPLFILSAYFIVLILSTIFSQDPTFSIFGSPSRAGGLLNSIFFFIFTIFIALFIKGEFWQKLIKTNLIPGLLASLLAVIQYFGLLKNIFIGFETGATPSFLGNSTFLAIYMIFLVFSSFTLFVLEVNRRKKWTYGIFALIFLFTVLITGSRSTYIGILIGFVFYFLFYPKKLAEGQDKLIKWITPKRLKTFKAACFIFIILILSSVAYVNMAPKLPDFIENNQKLSYFVHNRLSVKVVAEDLTGTRLSAWKITLKAIKEKPILGWGPENFHIGFEKYFDPKLPPSLQRQWWDRPHNIFLEIFVNSGILALIFYVSFWIAILWQLKIIKYKNEDNKNSHTVHGLQAMFLGYLTVLFFNFESFSTYLISSFFIGYAFYLISLSSTIDAERIMISPPNSFTFIKKPAAFIFLLIIILFFWFSNVKPFYFNEKIVLAKNLSDSKQCKKALQTINGSNWAKSGVLRPYLALNYSDVVKNCTFAEPEKEIEYTQKSLSLLKIASQIQPEYSRTWLFMGAFSNILAAREKDNKDIKDKILIEARNYLNKALELSPKRQEFLMEMEKNYLLAEDYESMKKIAGECIDIDSSIGECYWYLGIAEIFTGDQQNGKKHIQESKEKNYNNPAYIQLGVAYISQKNYKDAADAYQNLVAIHPENASYHATLALLLKETKNYERARMEAMEVFKLQPENQETIEFIRVLMGLSPDDIFMRYALVDIYRTLGDKDKENQQLLAIKSYYLQLIEKYPNMGTYHLGLARVEKELQEYQESYRQILLAIRLNPKIVEEAEYLLQLLPEEFIVKYREYLNNNPEEFFKRYGKYPTNYIK